MTYTFGLKRRLIFKKIVCVNSHDAAQLTNMIFLLVFVDNSSNTSTVANAVRL